MARSAASVNIFSPRIAVDVVGGRAARREVGAEEDLRRRHQLQQRRHRAGVRGAGQVVVERLQRAHEAGRHPVAPRARDAPSMRAARNGAVPPACDQMKRMSGHLRGIAAESDAGDGARGVGAVLEAAGPHARRVVEIAAAVGGRRVHVHDGFAPVQFVHHRPEVGVAQPPVAVAREEPDAVGLERVERVRDFAPACRPRRAAASRQTARTARGWSRTSVGAVVVARPRQAARHRRVAEPESRIGDRHDGGGDAAAIHVLDRFGRRPGRVGRLQQRTALDLGHPGGRREVMMDVDAVRPRAGGLCGAGAGTVAWRACREQAQDQMPPIESIVALARPASDRGPRDYPATGRRSLLAPADERHASDEQRRADETFGRDAVHRHVEPAEVIDDETGRQLADDDGGKQRGHAERTGQRDDRQHVGRRRRCRRSRSTTESARSRWPSGCRAG